MKPSLHVREGRDHALVLEVNDYTRGTFGEDSLLWSHTLSPAEQLEFLRDVTQKVLNNLASVAQDMQRGDCPTCRNGRLIEVEERGRKTSVHCPDCNASGSERPFSIYPIAGGGFAPRQPKESPDA